VSALEQTDAVGDLQRRTLMASGALFLLTAGFIAIRTGRDALYLQGDGLLGVPKAYMAVAFLSVPQAAAMLWMLERLGTRATRTLVLAAVLALVVAYWALAEPGGSALMTSFFFLVPLLFSVVFSMVWLLGTELLDGLTEAMASRAFARLGAASIIGGVCGGAFARALGPSIGPRGLILAGALLVAATLALVQVIHRTVVVHARATPGDDASPGVLTAFRQPGVGLLLGVSMAAAMTGIFVDFQFYLGAAGGTAEENTVYFANVYLVLSTASLFLQLVVAPWLQRAAGIRRTLLVLPVALFGGAATVLFMGTLMARAGLRVMEGGLKAGVHRTSWEQAYMAFPKEARATTKVLVDGLGARVAEGVAGLGLHLLLVFAAGGIGGSLSAVPWIASVSAAWVTAALVLSAACWAALTWALARRLRAATAHDQDARLRAPLPDS
jgi:hypothetical protein